MANTKSPQGEATRNVELITFPAAARLLGVSKRTIERMVERGSLDCIRISRRCVRLRLRDIEHLIEPT